MALNRGHLEAPGSYFWSMSVPFSHRPMGRGSGALTWWESFEVAKVVWHRRACVCVGGVEPFRPSSPRQKEKERREEGVRGGPSSTDLQNPPPPPPPGSPSREARTVSSRTPRTTLPPLFFSCQRLSQRARTYGDCAAFLPLGEKRTGSGKEEKAKRRTPPRARSAL